MEAGKGQGVRITSHAVSVVICRVAESGTVQFAVMTYTRKGRITLRNPMETGCNGERVLRAPEAEGGEKKALSTLDRLKGEVAADKENFDFVLLAERPIYCEFSRDERNQGGTHLKMFFAAEAVGKLRDYEIVERDLNKGREEVLGPIMWLEAGEVVRRMEGKEGIQSHLFATYGAMSFLARDPVVFERYYELLRYSTLPSLTPEQEEALEAYLKRQ